MTILLDAPAPGVARLLIDRPDARNAVDNVTRAALLDAIATVRADAAVRALVIGGRGGVFCSGGDLPSLIGLEYDAAFARLRSGHAIVASLWEFPKPVVAAVERFAVGAGAGLALLADHIVVGPSSSFVFPFLKLGLVPDWGLTGSLPHRVGRTRAARLLAESATVAASEAIALELADDLVADEDVMAHAVKIARSQADLPPGAFACLKALLRGEAERALSLFAEAQAQARCLASDEFVEGYAAFREKRSPRFS